MTEANRLLATQNTACMFVTLFHGVLDLATGMLRYCNAGHNPPYLLRAGGGRSSLKATGIPLGIEDEAGYRCAEIVLDPGDTLFLFSDGITEAFDAAGNEFGTARLEAALEAARGCSATDSSRGARGDRRLYRRGRAVRRHHLPGARPSAAPPGSIEPRARLTRAPVSAAPCAMPQDIAVARAAIIETVHQLAHQVDAETARRALFERQRQVGRRSAGRIEWPAVVDDLGSHAVGVDIEPHA